ncbi:MAG: hypothetical protein JNN21_00970 [Candidatus Accumulibacter sp.]|nr:hypothetical protein [Accumulibacter sp.]
MVRETKESCFDEFVVAREQLENLIGELRSESARILEHGEVESLISREGKELLRRLMQGYLDQRTAAEERYEGEVPLVFRLPKVDFMLPVFPDVAR